MSRRDTCMVCPLRLIIGEGKVLAPLTPAPHFYAAALYSQSSLEVVHRLLSFSGMWSWASILLFVACAGAVAGQQFFIRAWTDAVGRRVANEDRRRSDAAWVAGLVFVSLCDVLFRCLGVVAMAWGNQRLSQRLHANMLSRLLSSPTSFFRLHAPRSHRDPLLARPVRRRPAPLPERQAVRAERARGHGQTVRGRQPGLDRRARRLLSARSQRSWRWCTASARRRWCCTRRRRWWPEPCSTSVETRDTLSTVRSFGAVGRFCRLYCRLVDAEARAFGAYLASYRVTRCLAALAGLGVVLATLGFTLAASGGSASADVGLALSSALSIPILMMSITLSLFAVLQLLVQFQRTLEYTELPQEVGVVGRTGAGKSSLVQALLRVLVPTEGRILIDSVDISSLTLKKLRSAITVIPQDPTLVTGSLRDNLDPTRSHTDADIWDALKKSHLSEFVSRNPHGLDLAAGEGGANLSVGQRQLVCLARALLRRPKMLVLDEATSQMDGDTDRLIQSTLRQCFAGCTLLAIAHRVHTVLDYDKILVMAAGEVAEFGPTRHLLEDPSSLFHEIARDAGAIPPNGLHSPITGTAVSVPRPRTSFVAARILSSVPQA
ncbi:hypothetical protein HPB51_004800 [Rhipicephalus microplus]|uniref:Uncharacterized protein n=1 Tax=Rhipicephalus microplus TaxID=6941 RepID=A0A9J6E5C0_RHIMP|nr:hypothetical protein HPB51_004800 [Rhipicephalus microplus]